jgi:hypothetical protein
LWTIQHTYIRVFSWDVVDVGFPTCYNDPSILKTTLTQSFALTRIAKIDTFSDQRKPALWEH